MDDVTQKKAEEVYGLLCMALSGRRIKYISDQQTLTVRFPVQGRQYPGELQIRVDPEYEMVVLSAELPFRVKAARRLDMAVAVCALCYKLYIGRLEYDMRKGLVAYKMTDLYFNSQLSPGFFREMVRTAQKLARRCYRILKALNDGTITVEKFLKGE